MDRNKYPTSHVRAISPSCRRIRTTQVHNEQSSRIHGRQKSVERSPQPRPVDIRSRNAVYDRKHKYDSHNGRRTHQVSRINLKVQHRHQRVKLFPQTQQKRTYPRNPKVGTSTQRPVFSQSDAVYRGIPGVNKGRQGKQESTQHANKRYSKRSNVDYRAQYKDTDTHHAVVDFPVPRTTLQNSAHRPRNLKTTFAVSDDENSRQTGRPRSPYPYSCRSREPIKGIGRWSKVVAKEGMSRRDYGRCN